jgi:tetratricopeptide (TPR) repeat protein
MKFLCSLVLGLFMLLSTPVAFCQINSDSIRERIDVYYSNDTTDVQLTRDLRKLGEKYSADTLLLLIKQALIHINMYTNSDSGLVYGIDALELANRVNSKKDIADSYQEIGEALRIMGNYPKAVEFTLKALPISEELKDTAMLLLVYNQLGITYNGDGDFENALKAIFNSLSLINSSKMNHRDSLYSNLADIYLAEVYLNKNILDSALYYGNAARITDSSLRRNWSWIPYQLGNIYAKANNKDEALIYYNKALHTFWVKDSIDVYNGMAKLFLSDKSIDSAIHYANIAMLRNVSHSFLPEKLESSRILSGAYEIKSNKDSALKYLKLGISLKDSIFNLAKVREVQSLSLDETIRQREIAEQNKKEQENHVRNLQLLAIGLFIPIFFLGVLFLSRTRVKPRVVEFLGILSLLLFFEFITDLIYPFVSQMTNENPIWEMLFLVLLAALLEPVNFKLEHWVKRHLAHKTVHMPVPVIDNNSGDPGVGQNI